MTALSFAAATVTGPSRPTNQDALTVGGLVAACIDLEPIAIDLDPSVVQLVAVLDGMGGHAGGEVASRVGAHSLASFSPAEFDQAALRSALESADRAIRGAMRQDPDLAGMGTTVAGLIVGHGKVAVFNLGDSRVYASAGGYAAQLTEDHRVPGRKLVSRSLGGPRSPRSIVPFYNSFRIEEETRFLLCTDGLTDTLAFSQTQSLLQLGAPVDATRALLEASIAQDPIDNVTVVVVDVGIEDG